MKRYTETELEKIVSIGLCRIDQIIDRACAELEEIKPKALKDLCRGLAEAGSLRRGAMLESQMVSCVVGQHFSASGFQDCRLLANAAYLDQRAMLGLRGIK